MEDGAARRMRKTSDSAEEELYDASGASDNTNCHHPE